MIWTALAGAAAVFGAGFGAQALYAKKIRAKYQAPGVMVKADPDTPMHVYAFGEGPRAVILSGWGSAAPCVDYQPLMQELVSRGFRAVVVEKPGYGFSPVTKKPRGIDTVVGEIHAALHAAGEDGPYLMIGHSLAGTEILRFANLYPKETLGLLSLDAPAPLCYTMLPLPNKPSIYAQAFMRACSLWRLMMAGGRTRKFQDEYLNGYQLLSADAVRELNEMTNLNAANRSVRGEIFSLKENCVKAGDIVPDGKKLVMLIASDTREKNYEKLLPKEEEYIQKNHAAVYDVEGKHNLQQFRPARIAEIAAKEFLPA